MYKYDVVIVGAGAAGLSAAKQFEYNNISSVIILEASERIGGRVNTVSLSSHDFLDFGAQWIHGQVNNELFDLCCKNGLIAQKTSVDGEGDFYTEEGELIDSALVEEVLKVLGDIKEECCHFRHKQQDISSSSVGTYCHARFQEYLEGCIGEGNEIKNLKRYLYHWIARWERVDNACDSLNQLSLKTWGDFLVNEGIYNMNPKFGMTSLIQTLRNDVEAEIKFNSTVTNIDLGEDLIYRGQTLVRKDGKLPVIVTCKNGAIYQCQHVVVTPSLGVLKMFAKHIFQPPLPKPLLMAIENMGFGIINKIFLVYDESWWDEDFTGLHLVWTKGAPNFDRSQPDTKLINGQQLKMEDYWYRGITGFDPTFGHSKSLSGWIGGPEAAFMETLTEETVAFVCTKLIRQFLKNPSIPSPSKIYRTKWQSDPHFLGSYSYRPCGLNGKEIDTLNEPVCNKKKIPLMVLAGEANSLNYYSTIQGAMENGTKQAQHYVNYHHLARRTDSKL